MDLSVFDTGRTPRNLNGFGSGVGNLDLDEDLFSDTLLEVADLSEDDHFDTRDLLDDVNQDDDGHGDNDEAAAPDEENAEGGTQASSQNVALTPLELLLGIQAASTLSTSVGAPNNVSGATPNGSNTPSDAASRASGLGLQSQSASAASMTATQASLSGEAKVLNKRAQVIQANETHAQSAKAELAGTAEQKSAQTATAAKATETVQPSTVSGREASTPGNDIARLEQALRQAFPASGHDATSTAASSAATSNPARAGVDTLLATRGSEPITDTTNNLAATTERPTAMATAKAAATRPAFNLPNGRPAEQVSVQVQNAIRNGNDRIQIKLSPASLGNVEVKLELSPDKTVQAIVYADKSETLDMLERDARVLQKALEDAGLRTNSDSLSFAQRDSSGSGNAQADARDGAGGQQDANSEPDASTENNDSHLIETQARRSHDGLIDIEA